MQYDKYDTVSILLSEAMTPEKEHEMIQKQREKDWAQRGKAAGALAGFAGGAGSTLKQYYLPGVKGEPAKQVGGTTVPAVPGKLPSMAYPGVYGLAKTAAIGAGGALLGGYLGKKIAILVARMTKKGYSKPQIQQAVNQLKAKEGQR
jgi:hypothetical protein